MFNLDQFKNINFLFLLFKFLLFYFNLNILKIANYKKLIFVFIFNLQWKGNNNIMLRIQYDVRYKIIDKNVKIINNIYYIKNQGKNLFNNLFFH